MKTEIPALSLLCLIGLSGCSIPLDTRKEVTAGEPLTKAEAKNGLVAGTTRENTIHRYGQPSWTAFDQKVICYEGEFDYGIELKTLELVSAIALSTALGVATQGYSTLQWDESFTNDHREYRRVLIYFEQDRLVLVRAYDEIRDDPEVSRYIHLLEFSDEVGLPYTWLTREELRTAFQSEPEWSSEDRRYDFFGFIKPHRGDVDGLFVRYDDYGYPESYRRHHFGKMIKDDAFRAELDAIMAIESARAWME